jgi:hypothetical protein
MRSIFVGIGTLVFAIVAVGPAAAQLSQAGHGSKAAAAALKPVNGKFPPGWTYSVVSPRDPQSGLPTGKRMHKPVDVAGKPSPGRCVRQDPHRT